MQKVTTAGNARKTRNHVSRRNLGDVSQVVPGVRGGYLALLHLRQHHGVLWRAHVQLHDVALLREVRISRVLEGLAAMRLEFERAPD